MSKVPGAKPVREDKMLPPDHGIGGDYPVSFASDHHLPVHDDGTAAARRPEELGDRPDGRNFPKGFFNGI